MGRTAVHHAFPGIVAAAKGGQTLGHLHLLGHPQPSGPQYTLPIHFFIQTPTTMSKVSNVFGLPLALQGAEAPQVEAPRFRQSKADIERLVEEARGPPPSRRGTAKLDSEVVSGWGWGYGLPCTWWVRGA